MGTATTRRFIGLRWLLWLLFVVGGLVDAAGAQDGTSIATIDPSEARALNTMFQKWGISATNQWNISGELCSGVAIDSTGIENINPGIKCDCSADNGTSCHITAMRVYALDVAGSLPDELWNLTFMTDLNLGKNYLTGPIPPSIGNLSRMQYLSFGINALSGNLPRELGLLTDLRSLSFSTNNFSGPLPTELGNLSRLTQIYFDSSGVSGLIPETFANLRSLEKVWASDNQLTGGIPDFIGNWTNLLVLRFQGNSFQGPIPSSFSNLISLNDLRISDVLNASSSLDFLRNMTSLATLFLRNNNISGSLPTYFGQLQSLTIVDLSFNKLTGSVPDSLFNHNSLTNLFLGNNGLTGPLPSQKSPRLQNIDLSYNELSGRFPSWIREQNLQLNLVANNFAVGRSNYSVLPSGLYCLQRSFPCSRRSPIYSSFAINCGGPQIRSWNQIVYERENETLGPATQFMTSTGRWAVSNAGLPSDTNSPQYRSVSLSQFTNTLDSELFQTSKISAGSLRYYGLGLKNGNYKVTLQFAKTEMLGTRTWRSLGRRIFDVYIQGSLVLRDFDIQRETGGIPLRAIERDFTVQVSENYLVIHLFWAGKGTCCVPTQGTYGPAISAISATPNFVPTVSNNAPGSRTNLTGVIVGIFVAAATASLVSVLAVFFVIWKRWQKNFKGEDENEELLAIKAPHYIFSYSELKAATKDFNPANKLGEGGSGQYYKGTLANGCVVAIKQLSQLSAASHQSKNQFIAEVASVSDGCHRNLVKLYGCCIEGDQHFLVCAYIENCKSLDQLLFGDESKSQYLDLHTRYMICWGMANALRYLHHESRRVGHGDVKSCNILLNTSYVVTPRFSRQISTGVAGTMADDIFDFGVLALEIVSGSRCDRAYLLEWAWNLHEENGKIDPDLVVSDTYKARLIIGVALLCIQADPALRPAMADVFDMLCWRIKVPPVTLNDLRG